MQWCPCTSRTDFRICNRISPSSSPPLQFTAHTQILPWRGTGPSGAELGGVQGGAQVKSSLTLLHSILCLILWPLPYNTQCQHVVCFPTLLATMGQSGWGGMVQWCPHHTYLQWISLLVWFPYPGIPSLLTPCKNTQCIVLDSSLKTSVYMQFYNVYLFLDFTDLNLYCLLSIAWSINVVKHT